MNKPKGVFSFTQTPAGNDRSGLIDRAINEAIVVTNRAVPYLEQTVVILGPISI